MKSLLRSRCDSDGRMCGVYEACGLRVRVYDDARTMMKVIDLFADTLIQPSVKLEVLMRLLFPNFEGVRERAGDRLGELLCSIVWEIAGLDISEGGSRRHEKPLFDWDADEAYIRTTMLSAYGETLDALVSRITYRDLAALVLLAPHETPMGQAIYYRTAKPPKPTKYNQDEIREFKRRQRAWRLDATCGGSGSMESGNDIATSAFASIASHARRCG